MSVTLRKREMSGGRQTLYLDYYYDGQRRQESLKLYIYKRPKSEEEKSHNKEALRQAQSIRSKRELDQNAIENGLSASFKKSVDFFAYFESIIDSYTKKNIRGLEATLNHLKEFTAKQTLPIRLITEQLCIDFRDYLDSHLNGETPYDYFAHFKRVLKRAKREGILMHNPASDIISRRAEGKMKDELTIEEIQTLASTPCGNEEVRRAFLFSCFTGLRTCDIRALKWRDVKDGKLTLIQSKTKQSLTVYLHPTAQVILGEPQKPDQLIFQLPTQNGINKVLKYWAQRALLKQHITFHCARVSFGTNLSEHESDIHQIAVALGQTNLRHTRRYVKVAEARKQQVINKLPGINLNF